MLLGICCCCESFIELDELAVENFVIFDVGSAEFSKEVEAEGSRAAGAALRQLESVVTLLGLTRAGRDVEEVVKEVLDEGKTGLGDEERTWRVRVTSV